MWLLGLLTAKLNSLHLIWVQRHCRGLSSAQCPLGPGLGVGSAIGSSQFDSADKLTATLVLLA